VIWLAGRVEYRTMRVVVTAAFWSLAPLAVALAAFLVTRL